MDMEELREKLIAIPDSYEGFVLGILNYAEKKTSRLRAVLQFIGENEGVSSSDVVKFVMEQLDFHEFSAVKR